jgi:membrane protein required for colicin V production
MNFLDIIIIVPIIYASYKGFKHGFVIELFTLLALFVGIYAGIHFSDMVAEWLKESAGWDSPYIPVVSFTLTFLAVGAMIYFGGKAVEKMIKVVQLNPLNKAAGIFFSAIKMLYILSIILVLLESYDEKGQFFPEETKNNSLLYHPVKDLSTKTVPGLANSTIFLGNALKEEKDSTGLTVQQILRAKEVADSLGIDAQDAKTILEIHQKYGKEN